MCGDNFQKALQFFSSLLDKGTIKISQILLFRQGWNNKPFKMLIFLQLSLEPFKIAEPTNNYVNGSLIVTW